MSGIELSRHIPLAGLSDSIAGESPRDKVDTSNFKLCNSFPLWAERLSYKHADFKAPGLSKGNSKSHLHLVSRTKQL